MMIWRRITVLGFILLVLPATAGAVSAWQFTGSANIGFSGYQDSQRADSQYEFSVFVDGQYLDGFGLGGGYIHQDRSAPSNSSLVNNSAYLGIWKTLYTDAIPGKLTVLLDSYSVNGSSSVDQGKGKGATTTTPPETDDIDVLNPTIIYMNSHKDLDFELSYASSHLRSDSGNLADVSIRQWAPALAVYLNERYDRIRVKHYAIDLTNDNRTPGVTHTNATEIKWTHWARSGGTGLTDITLSLLAGERLYGVDRDARRIDSFAEILTGSAGIGTTWGLNPTSAFYMFAGLERYRDPDVDSQYTAGYIYGGVRKQW
jgi:hypothetical protein